jgi:UDP-glucose 4-epimerase
VDEADVVVHLAAAVGVRLIVESPVRTVETNVGATELVLAAAAKKCKRVLVASTSEVYGKSTTFPFSEDQDLVLGPSTKGRWSYAASKLIDEFLALAYWRERKLPTTVVRLFNTVGPRQTGRYGMVVPTFVRQALAGEPLTVFGDGAQSRCFGHVLDVVAALEKLCLTDAAVGEIYNVGATDEVTILDLARRILLGTESRSEIVLVPYERAYEAGFEDMPRRIPDISKVGRAIGYRPTRGLDDILRDVIAFERGRPREGNT